jgi:hypothetical protein
MTANVVSLSRARKTRARAKSRAAADANAARFGRTKAERTAETQDADKAARHLDQHRREDAEK